MAERTVTVRLKAQIDAYQKAMGEASRSSQRTAQEAAASWQRLGRSTASLGDSMTRSITLPLVAVGAAATKMAMDFDAPFQQMVQLAGVSASEIDGLKESVLDLAGETGKAPTELAEALYFLRSSGLEGAAAMDALEMSAKASAAGLGSTVQIADAVSSAMNAYAREGLSAAEATDVLVATAKAGKAEPAELAAQMGRLLPISSELGITFNDVGAALASLSLSGNDAAASSTQLSALMGKLLRPSQQARDALTEVGLSVDDIRTMIDERGLLGTLELLKERLGDSGFALFLEDQQAVQAGLALTGQNADKVREIFGDLSDVTGETDNAFGQWAQTMGAQNAKGFADMQAAMIRFGDMVAPVFADVMQRLGDMVAGFSDLPGPIQDAAVFMALFVAALGPIMSIGGRVVTALSTAVTWYNAYAVSAGRAAISSTAFSGALTRMGQVGAVVGGLLVLREVIGTLGDKADEADMSQLTNDLLDLADTGRMTGDELRAAMDNIRQAMEDNGGMFSGDTEQMRQSLADLDEALAQLAARDPQEATRAFRAIKEEMLGWGVPAEIVDQAFGDYQAALAEADTASRTTEGSVASLGGEFGAQGEFVGDATTELERYANQLQAMYDPLFAMTDALQSNRDAQAAISAAELELAAAQRDHGAGSLEAMAAQDALNQAMNDGARAVVDLQGAAAGLRNEMENNGLTSEAATAQFVGLATQAGYTGQEALEMAAMFGIATSEADRLAVPRTVPIDEEGGDPTRRTIRSVEGSAESLNRQRPNVSISATDRATGTINGILARLRAIDGTTATTTVTTREIIVSQPGTRPQRMPARAKGGPVEAYQSYLVGEKGPEILTMAGAGGMIYPNEVLQGESRYAAMAGPWVSGAAAGSGGGGGDTVVVMDMRGAIIANDNQFRRMVKNAWNDLAQFGEVNVRGARLRTTGR